MYAVVEPYVISAKLQAELMKRGLIANIIGAGSNTSALSPIKDAGYGFLGATCSLDSRNVLGVEWVLPTGEIIRTGSLGAGAGWCYSEGPGPSLRGIIRGQYSARGGIGIFTKASLKVYNWSGPKIPEIEGTAPTYQLKMTPDMLMKLWYIHFPTSAQMAEALYRLSESEVCFMLNRYGATQLAFALGDSNEEGMEILEQLEKEIKVGGFAIIIMADSEKEFAYKEKVVRQVASETEARFLQMVEEPRYQGLVIWRLIRASVASKEVFRPGGVFGTSFGGLETIDFAVNRMDFSNELKQRHIAKGKMIAKMEDFNWGNAYEAGHMAHIDNMVMAHPTPQGIEGIADYLGEAAAAAVDPELKLHTGGIHLTIGGDKNHDAFGPANSNYHLWLRAIKQAFDPTGAAEANYYITPNDEYSEGFFKFAD
jgi:glycolate oxidase